MDDSDDLRVGKQDIRRLRYLNEDDVLGQCECVRVVQVQRSLRTGKRRRRLLSTRPRGSSVACPKHLLFLSLFQIVTKLQTIFWY